MPPSAHDRFAHADAWIVSGHRFTDPRPGPSAVIDLDAPRDGIHIGGTADPASDDHVLALDLRPQWRLADQWPRGADVTAIYESDDPRHLRATAMWRLHPCGPLVRGWQAIVSAQTSLLHSDSILAVTSTFASLPGDECLWGECIAGTVRWRQVVYANAGCILLRRCGERPGGRESVLVAAHPGEVRRIEARPAAGRIAVSCWLFSSHLEKGVLLRSRVLVAVGPAEGDEAWAADAATAFAALPPMLTT